MSTIDRLPIAEATVISNDDEIESLVAQYKACDAIKESLYEAYQVNELNRAKTIGQLHKLTSSEGFEKLCNDKLSLSKTIAYQYIDFLKNNDLIELFHTSGNDKLKISHVFALLPKRNDTFATALVREEIKEDLKKGGKVSVSEIERKLKETQVKLKETQKTADFFEIKAKENGDELQAVKANLEQKALETLKAKEMEIEERANQLAQANTQATINSLNLTIATQRSNLAKMEREGERAAIDAEIAEKEARNQELDVKKNQFEYEKHLRIVAKQVTQSMAGYKTATLEAGKSPFPVAQETFDVLMDACDAIDVLREMLFTRANANQPN